MFKRRQSKQSKTTVTIEFEGKPIAVNEGETVSAALLASGAKFTRTTEKEKARRAPYCQMGVCFECLVEIDGLPNQQACLTPVREGMKIKRQHGLKKIKYPLT